MIRSEVINVIVNHVRLKGKRLDQHDHAECFNRLQCKCALFSRFNFNLPLELGVLTEYAIILIRTLVKFNYYAVVCAFNPSLQNLIEIGVIHQQTDCVIVVWS